MHERTSLWKGLALVGTAALLSGCITINLLPGAGPLEEKQLSGSGTYKVLMVELSGLISSRESEGLVEQPNPVAHLKEELTRAANDSKVKALVVRINSPGGTVTASDVLYHELRAFKEKRKIPVIASIMDVGASGGYYVAVAADKIMVHPSSVTGSLGVIMLTVNARGLLEKIGLEATAVASGPKKDMGSPFRTMTDEERAIFQGVIDSFYQRFLSVIQEGRRNLTPEEIRKLADGRIYSGEQAKALGLVDSVGYLDDAIELAKRQAGLTDARVVVYRRPGEYRHNIYSRVLEGGSGWTALSGLDLMAIVRGGTPQFMYLWMP
ncbi:MAG: signal peptide peptidase SppA [Nitrospirae bacterium]|nr:MAG: signal peptidase [Nitrospirae bacterium 13_2_20CM_2_62_8]OLC41305.1 MAG: signal peptidase [Nitrospirae bacterium 13_1_40CM_4_62_6]OLC80235.1 MAG: signal peptidase [Nitrospirae bacterium 13_1_40CM_3_62_11]OLD36783.1 MAG: signal peptidase [Nitrospirae bacterium 13_1_40CM_2_62_10]OLE42066.1 MAG: signal peptidase [Nitrospirae bacterium 13_1_20CM_2_62_14]TLY38852.1 MAG: signal peptide peptidase SppA [Nitrospirota bacterium]